jgi:UDP:flavonoid glycosyltransferase YjiC (YdhE family)
MHALIVTIGSHGDLYPFLAVGRALETRGHRCTVLTDRFFAADVASAGLEMRSLPEGISIEKLWRHPHLFHRFHGPALLMRRFDSGTQPLTEALRHSISACAPDLVLAHHIALPAGWIAGEQGIPCATAVLAPFAWNAPDDPVPVLQSAPGAWRRRQARALAGVLDPVLRSAGDAWVNGLRTRTGFPTARNALWGGFRSGDLNLALWSSAFRPPLPSDPPRGVICGFPRYDGDPGARLDEDLERFLAAGEPPVVFTLGSAAVHTAAGFFAIAAQTCARLGLRGVLLIGPGNTPPPALPRDVIAAPWAPHSLLFPRALVNVHHGGIGTSAQALRAGRPALVIPHAYDQFNNAVRVATLGTGLMLARHRVTAARLEERLKRSIGDASITARAEEFSRRLADEDGASVAAGHLERLVGSGRRMAA